MPNASRKVTANQVAAAKTASKTAPTGRATTALTGTLVEGAMLGNITGRGRPAIPLSAQDIDTLQKTREGKGVGEFTGNLSEVMRFKGRVQKWCAAETDAGRPTKPSFRTYAGNFPNPKKGIEASASITIRYAAVAQNDVDEVL